MIVLDFPKDRSIGVFWLNNPGVDHVRSPAKGKIAVPKDGQVELTVNYDTAGDLSPLRKLPAEALYKLDLGKLEIKDDQLKDIERFTHLHSLNLERTDITSRGLEHLRGMKELANLNLAETLVKSDGMRHLAHLTQLQSLALRITDVGDDGMEDLAKLPNLHRLYLSRTKLTDAGMKKLAGMKCLQMLDVSFNSRITDAGIANLKGIPCVDDLNVSNTRVTGKCIPYLKQIPSLHKVLYNGNNFTDKDIALCRRQLPRCEMKDTDKHRDVPVEMFAPLH